MMFKGTCTLVRCRAVRNLLHDGVSLETLNQRASDRRAARGSVGTRISRLYRSAGERRACVSSQRRL
jgi:hypothetical protein